MFRILADKDPARDPQHFHCNNFLSLEYIEISIHLNLAVSISRKKFSTVDFDIAENWECPI
jgi:hypothetical protein